MEQTVAEGTLEVCLGLELFTVLDFADDVALLAETLEVLVMALEVMDTKARQFGPEFNARKTKIQTTEVPHPYPPSVLVAGNDMEVHLFGL